MTEEIVKIDPEQLSRSLTGFDEIAIQRMFQASFETLKGTIAARALIFIHEKRQGMNDADSFRKVMEMPLGDLEKYLDEPEAVEFGVDADVEGKA